MAQRLLMFHLMIAAGSVLVCLSIFSSHASSAVIHSLKISGNTAFTSRQLVDEMSSRISLTYSPTIMENDIRSMVERYRRAGYIDVVIAIGGLEYSPDCAFVDVDLSVNEGRQALLARIAVTGQNQFTEEEILSRFDLKPGRPLDESVLEQDMEELLSRYERAGFPLANARLQVWNAAGETNPIPSISQIVRPIPYAVVPPSTQLADLLRSDAAGRDHANWSDDLAHAIGAIAGLTAVDGATVINADCEVLAFGAKIGRPPGAQRVEQVVVTEPIEGAQRLIVHPTELGGTRHLSAAQFEYDQRDSASLVASQDGRFTIFAWSPCEDMVHAHRVETLLL